MTNNRSPGTDRDRLGDLIRAAYKAKADVEIPVDLAARVRHAAERRPRRLSAVEIFWEYFPRPLVWVPTAAAVAAVLLAIGLSVGKNASDKETAHVPVAQVEKTSVPQSASTGANEKDPLGSDFFQFNAEDDEPVAVELADGWNAVTIEDSDSDTALVYFYSDDENGSGVEGVQ
jgi:hypothetical protein